MNYVGIDLGTTNSAICSFDGETVKLYKSPEQHDVTPSAILFDKRGNRYVGARAYNAAAANPDSAATVFKRMMGTSTPIKLPAVGLTLTPEECSAEILRTLYGYLPEDLRTGDETGTVITVPAAFNQMQKDATMAAAEAAGLGRVALMQEPVAAVMSVMRQRRNDGTFLVYDIGGGTLDIAIAQSISGRVSLLAHGGIAMCGGRDFDRILYDNIVLPWLFEKFDLPEDMASNPLFRPLARLGTFAVEKAKIELSQREEAVISTGDDLKICDLSGNELYIDIPIRRDQMDSLIAGRIDESIVATRETLEKAGLNPHDVERMVFVGGPAHYKPLRDKVSFELGIAASTEVNVMTAVAEGAAVFAESIDWASQSRGRKSNRGALSTGGPLDLSFNYTARTPESRARVMAKPGGAVTAGTEYQIDSLDTGWSSGRMALREGAGIELSLTKPGENKFKVFVFAPNGAPVALRLDRITITRTAASIDAIPASHSIAVEALERVGGVSELVYLVKEGDQLPKRGQMKFKSIETLKAGSSGAIVFNLWEGDIKDKADDNRMIGAFQIKGTDFGEGIIAPGADLICDFELLDSGCLNLEVSVPSIGSSFPSQQNFYSAQSGMVDYTNQARAIREQSAAVLGRVDEIAEKIDDSRLEEARHRLEAVARMDVSEADPEVAKQADEEVRAAKKLIAQTRQDNRKVIRQIDLNKIVTFFNSNLRDEAKPSEQTTFDNLARTAQRAIDNNTSDFEPLFDEMRGRVSVVLFRMDGFVVDKFRWLAESQHLFVDTRAHTQLVADGHAALKAGDIASLRQVVLNLDRSRSASTGDEEMASVANILRAS